MKAEPQIDESTQPSLAPPSPKQLDRKRVMLLMAVVVGLLLVGVGWTLLGSDTTNEEEETIDEVVVETTAPNLDEMARAATQTPPDVELELSGEPDERGTYQSQQNVPAQFGQRDETSEDIWKKEKILSTRRHATSAFQDGFDARRAEVFFKNEPASSNRENQTPSQQPYRSSVGMPNGATRPQSQTVDDRKAFFANENVGESAKSIATLRSNTSPYEVKGGTILKLVLETGINSDQPGLVKARFTEPIFDTVTGRYLLIPSGTTMLGTYNATVAYGQSRIQVAWTRLLLPNGDSMDLGNLPGIDLSGQSGFSDQVDGHWDKILGAALLTSALSTSAAAAKGTTNGYEVTPSQAAMEGLSESVQSTGKEIMRKQLNVQPTLRIRSGHEVAAFVRSDLQLKPYTE